MFVDKFNALWTADLTALADHYPSETGQDFDWSGADFALMLMLADQTGCDFERMRSLFGQSALGQRHKWMTRERSYQDRTIKNAIDAYRPTGDPRLVFQDQAPAIAAPVLDPFAQALASGNDQAIAELFAQGHAIAAEFRNLEPPPQEWIIESCLPLGVVAGLVASGGTGKGHFELMMAFRVALGARFGPFNVPKARPVMLITLEDHKDEMHRRFRAAAACLIDPPLDNIQIIPLAGKGPFDMDLILALIERHMAAGGLVIIDPLIKMVPKGVEINTQSDTAHILAMLEATAFRIHCTILFAHHTSKQVARDGGQLQGGAASGSQMFDDLSRVVFGLKQLTDSEITQYDLPRNDFGYVEFRMTKVNYHEQQVDVFVMKRVEGGALVYIPAKNRSTVQDMQMLALLPLAPDSFDGETWDERAKEDGIPAKTAGIIRRRLSKTSAVITTEEGRSHKKVYSRRV